MWFKYTCSIYLTYFFRSRQIENVGLIVINFHAIYPNASTEAILRKWERAVLEFAVNSLNDDLVHVHATSEGLMSEEVRRTGKILPI